MQCNEDRAKHLRPKAADAMLYNRIAANHLEVTAHQSTQLDSLPTQFEESLMDRWVLAQLRDRHITLQGQIPLDGTVVQRALLSGQSNFCVESIGGRCPYSVIVRCLFGLRNIVSLEGFDRRQQLLEFGITETPTQSHECLLCVGVAIRLVV